MPLPHRNNPKIVTNWYHKNTKNVLPEKQKRAYYDITTIEKPGWLKIKFREEKKRLGGSAEREEHWYGSLEFELNSTFAKDLKMFLNEFINDDAEEIKNIVRLYPIKKGIVAQKGNLKAIGKTEDKALKKLAKKLKEVK